MPNVPGTAAANKETMGWFDYSGNYHPPTNAAGTGQAAGGTMAKQNATGSGPTIYMPEPAPSSGGYTPGAAHDIVNRANIFRGGGGLGGGYTIITPKSNPNTGASNKLLEQLIAGMQSGYDQANAASLAQYQNLLDLVTGLQQNVVGPGGVFDQAMSNIEGMGTSARQRVAENMQHQLGATEQDMTSRGLGNTTIRQSGLRGVRRDAERAHQAIDEQVGAARSGLLLQKAGAMSDLGRLHADSILSRSNEGPNLSMMLSLIQQLASSLR